ncbi:NAD(P)/FAD-dependent oxidoreductase [Hoeflea sp.]|uniref:NAD(P)/FAD-dependent oxidoreductase n=1 Tax=Hoeflea sp. TaxID=1940281 RepID=UPI003A9587DE
MHGFPITLATPPDHTGLLPEAVDVTVIGGGIIGLMTAWELSRDGLRVLLCEKGKLAGEQSGRNWGWLRQQGRDLAELPIAMDAMRIWRDLPQAFRAAIGFRQTGVTYLARDASRMAAFESWLSQARPHGVDTRLLSRRETEAMLPNAAGWIGALHTPSDGQAEPFVTVPLLARAAVEEGVVIRERCAVRGLELSAEQVSGVVTEAGTVRCARVVLAGGAWSSLFLATHGVRLRQLSVLSSVSTTEALPEGFSRAAAADERFAIRGRADGGHNLTAWSSHKFFIGPDAVRNLGAFLPQFLADVRSTKLRPFAPQGYPDAWRTPRRWSSAEKSPFERCRILNPHPDTADIARLQHQFALAFPDIGKPTITASWAGMIDVTPDTLPVVDHAPIPGLIVATGMSGHGFGIAPGMAKVIADLVQGRAPQHEMSPFRYKRFFDGTPTKASSAI